MGCSCLSRSGVFVVVLIVIVPGFVGVAVSQTEDARFLPTNLNVRSQNFGMSVAVSGGTALIGAYGEGNGTAYFYERAGDNWAMVTKAIGPDLMPSSGDKFGTSVSVDGDWAVVGAPYARVGGDDFAGAAFTYHRVNGIWEQDAMLAASDYGRWQEFGRSVSISGNVIVVGDGEDHSGAAYVFERDAANWSQVTKLTASAPGSRDYYGNKVSVDGSYIVVGAPWDDRRSYREGAAYVYERDASGWQETAKLYASDGGYDDSFAASISVSGERIMIASIGDDDRGAHAGAVYVYERTPSGWTETVKLTADDAIPGATFGRSVSIDGDLAVVGAYQDTNLYDWDGSAYVFQHGETGWEQIQKLTTTDASIYKEFGTSVAIDGEQVLVGMPRYEPSSAYSYVGAAYAFDVPEPATLSLFLLGGAALLRRRK